MEDDKNKIDGKNPPPTPPTGEAGPPLKKEEGIEILKTELEACKKQAEEYLNGWKRAKADYINLKKETETANAELAQFVAVGVLMKILPVYDGLKKACITAPEGDKWAEGILNIKKQFEEVFKSFGIEEIKAVGEKFNPEFHEAVSREKREGVESDVILEEVSSGYKMNGKTIIPAKVVVSE
jgi:molecular chaperone GrpE